MNELISIIVPVYNKAPYLMECLESLCLQTYNNIEIILVDDGSTDQSGNICQRFCTLDNRVHYLYQSNQGQNSARKTGVESSNGDWIIFVDADDVVDYDMCKNLLHQQHDSEADVVFGRIKLLTHDGKGKLFPILHRAYSGRELIHDVLSSRFFGTRVQLSLYSILFRKKYVLAALRQIDLRITYSEDVGVLLAVLLDAKKVDFIKKTVYYYRVVSGSVAHSHDTSNIIDQKHLLHYLYRIFSQHNVPQEDYRVIKWYIIRDLLLSGYEFFNDFKGLFPYFTGKRFKRIGIYGAGEIGKEMVKKLHSGFFITGWYDKNYEVLQHQGIKVSSPDDIDIDSFDVLVVALQDPDIAKMVVEELRIHLPSSVPIYPISQDILDSEYVTNKIKELATLNEEFLEK